MTDFSSKEFNKNKPVVVYAPASIGNVGVGFDVLGAAVSPIDGSLLGDRVKVEPTQSAFELSCTGHFVSKLPTEPKENIVYDCWTVFARELAKKDIELLPVKMTLEKNMPIGSGLGSSACSITAALHALNEFHGNPLNPTELLALMGEMEGQISGSIHYDNVAPCYLGGLQFMVDTEIKLADKTESTRIISQSVPCFDDWIWVMAYPGIKVSTAEARSILPEQYPRQQVIAHGRHLGGFIHACHTGQAELAASLMQDVIAEPYRQSLLPNFAKSREYALSAGALACGISGSGPTLFTICPNLAVAENVASWLDSHYKQNDEGFVHICKLETKGSTVMGTEL